MWGFFLHCGESLVRTWSWSGPINKHAQQIWASIWEMALSLRWPLQNRFLWAEVLCWRICQDAFACRCLLSAPAPTEAQTFASAPRSVWASFFSLKAKCRRGHAKKLLFFKSTNHGGWRFIQNAAVTFIAESFPSVSFSPVLNHDKAFLRVKEHVWE